MFTKATNFDGKIEKFACTISVSNYYYNNSKKEFAYHRWRGRRVPSRRAFISQISERNKIWMPLMRREAIQQIFAAGISSNDRRFANVTPSPEEGGSQVFGNYGSITSSDAAGKLSLLPFITLSLPLARPWLSRPPPGRLTSGAKLWSGYSQTFVNTDSDMHKELATAALNKYNKKIRFFHEIPYTKKVKMKKKLKMISYLLG